MRRSILFIFIYFITFLTNTKAATIESTATGAWNLTSTWLGGVIPSAADDVIIKNGHSVSLNDTRSCITLTIESGATFNHNNILNQSGTLTNQGTINWTSGSFNGAGVITNNGIVFLTSTSAHNTVSNIINNGTINWNEGHLDQSAGGQVLTNTGTLNLNSPGYSLGMSIVNTGTITRTSGTGGISFTQPIDNQVSGIITIPTGTTCTFSSGSSLIQSGTFTVDGTLNFSATGTYVINDVNSFSGSGTINITHFPTFNSSVGWQPIIPVINQTGVVAGAVSLTIDVGTTWNWTNGDFTLPGPITNNGAVIITGSGQHNTASNIINNGTLNWNDGHLDAGGGGQVLTNTGTLNLNSSGGANSMSIINTGNITRTTAGTINFTQPVDNQLGGTILIPSGMTCTFATGSSMIQSGTFTVDGTLNFSATGTYVINVVNSFSGSGTINITHSPTFNGSAVWQPIIPVINQTGIIAGNVSLTIDNSTTWNWINGDFTLTNPIINNGTLIITSNFQPHNTASNIINNGTLNWNDGHLDAGGGGQVLTNTGTLNLNSSGYANSMSIINTGNITRTTAGTINFTQPVDNQLGGTILIPSGMACTFGTGSSMIQSGTFMVNGTLNFSATGTYVINVVNSFSGSGTINITHSPTFNGSAGWQPIIPVINQTGIVAGNVSLTIDNSTTWNWINGDFTLTNPIINNGTLIITSNFQPHNTASNIINNGTINWNEGHFDQSAGGQVLTNTGTLNLNSPGNSLGMSIVNTGTITRTSGTGGINFSQPIDNQVGGTILIPSNFTFTFGTGSSLTQSGTITVDGTLSFGAISVTQNALINLNGTCNITAGSHNISTNGGFTGNGILVVSGGTINFNIGSIHSGSLIISGGTFNDNIGLALQNVTINSGTYGGTGNGVVNGIFSWTQGTITGSNLLTVNGTGSVTTTNPKTLSGSKELRIAGSTTFTNTPLFMSGTAKLSVEIGGTLTWDVTTSSNTVSGTATNIVEVKSGGTFIKTGANLLEIRAQMDMNNGSIQVLGGILKSSSAGTTSTFTNGTISIASTGTMEFSRSSGTVIHNITGTIISGSGKLEVSTSATANFESGTQINVSGTIAASSSGVANIKPGVTVTLSPSALIIGGTITDDVGIISNNFTLDGSGTYGGSGNAVVNGTFSWLNGTITGSNLMTINGVGSVTTSSTKTLSGSKELRIAGSTTFTNTPLTMSGTAKLSVESGGTLTWDVTTSSNTVSGTATNIMEVKSGGTFIKSGPNLLEIRAQMDMNNGSIQVLGGILKSSNAGTTSTFTNGTISIASTGTMEFSRSSGTVIHNITGTIISGSGKLEVSTSATANFESGTQINVSGTIAASSSGVANIKPGVTVTLSPSALIIGGTITDDVGIISNNFTLDGSGTYGGSGNAVVNGTFSWLNGTITGSNLMTINGVGSVTTSSTKTLSGSKELRIAGSTTFTNTPLTMSGTAKLSVESGGTLTWDVTTSSNTVSGTATNIMEVKSGGTFIKSGPNLLEIRAQMNMNNGSIQVLGGILKSSSAGTTSTITNGTISIASTGTMEFSRSSGTVIHNITGTIISGSGKLEVSTSATANFENGTQINVSGTIAASSSGVANIKPGVTVTLSPSALIIGGTITDDVGIISNNFTLDGSGTYGGSGNAVVNGTFSWLNGTITGSNLITINGVGSVTTTGLKTLSGSKELRIAGSTTFTNTPLFMSGTGKLSVESGGTLTWDVTTSSNTVSGTATNIVEVKSGGTFIKSGANLLEIRAQMNMNNGSIQVLGGILNSSGSGSARTLINGTISIGATATMEFSGSVTNIIHNITGTIISGAGELKVSTSATANFESGTQINVSGTIAASSGVANIKPGVTVTLSPSALIISGTITDDVGIISNNFTLDGSGTYGGSGNAVVNGTFSWLNGTITGSNLMTINGVGSVTTTGPKTLSGSKELRIAGTINIPNNTAFGLSGTAKLKVLSGGICSGGTGTLNGTASNLIEVQTGGIWEKTVNPNWTINPPFVNQGLIRGANLITFNSTFINTNGTVSPGFSPGVLVFNKFDNTNATLIMEIGGAGPAGTDRDSLRVTGSPALLNGTLDLRLINGYTPDSNQAFNLVSLPIGFGTFQSLITTGIPDFSMSWKLEYGTTLVKARYCPMWYADVDGDGFGDYNNISKFCDCIAPPVGFVRDYTDCDDTDPLEKPGQTWYIDADGDDFGVSSVVQCLRPSNGFVIAELSGTGTDDCDDTDPLEKPGQTWYIDADGDDFGVSSIIQCLRPTNGFVIAELSGTGTDDCDDTDPLEKPGQTWYIDADGDDFGVSSIIQCLRPTNGFVIAELSGTGTDDCDDTDPLEKPGQTWYIDADGDDFGVSSIIQCLRPTNGFVIAELSGTGTDDCDDTDPLEKPGQTWYIDADGDDYGVSSLVQCLRPTNGFVLAELSGTGTDDCDDTDPLEKPGQTWYIDADSDDFGVSSIIQCLRPTNGFVIAELSGTGTDDCDDTDALEKPGQTWYIDADGDDYGVSSVVQCLRPSNGFVIAELSGTGTDDCDDTDPLEKPGQTWYIDVDGDDFGVSSVVQCLRPTNGFVLAELSGTGTDDCDDTDPLEKPGQTWYIDADGDDFGVSSVVQCLRPTNGFVIVELSGTGTDDCDDTDPLEKPGQTWYIDADGDDFGVSSVVQCLRPTNGFVLAELSGTGTDDCDDADVLEKPGQTWYIDADGDDFGVSSVVQCLRPTNGFVIAELSGTGTDDCDDTDALEKPGQTWYIDADGDDYGVSSVVQCLRPSNGFVIAELSGTGTDDCDDTDPLEKPGQTWYIDVDGDDFGVSSVVQCLRPTNGFVLAELSGTGTDDCDDTDPLEKPGQTWYIDADGDDFGVSSVVQCLRPTNGFVIAELSGTGTDDCDDTDALEKPGQTWYIDADGDDYGVSSVVQCLRPSNGFVIAELSGTGTDDCDDTDPLEKPGQTWYIDADGDDFGVSSVVQCLRPTNGFVLAELSGTGTDDCDDAHNLVFPNSTFVKSYANGNWDDPNVWLCGRPTMATDTIALLHHVSLNIPTVALDANITVSNGSLNIQNNKSLTLGSTFTHKIFHLNANSTLSLGTNSEFILYGLLNAHLNSTITNSGYIVIK